MLRLQLLILAMSETQLQLWSRLAAHRTALQHNKMQNSRKVRSPPQRHQARGSFFMMSRRRARKGPIADFLATVTAAGTCTDLQGFTRLYQQTQKTAVGKSVRVNFR